VDTDSEDEHTDDDVPDDVDDDGPVPLAIEAAEPPDADDAGRHNC
jgi:hypothetical protein